MTRADDNRQKLIAILQLAYSGELAAAYAYRGHWQAVSAADIQDVGSGRPKAFRTSDGKAARL